MRFDVLVRARQALSDYEWAKACKVEPAWPNRLIEDLATEVEKLRSVIIDGAVDAYKHENNLT